MGKKVKLYTTPFFTKFSNLVSGFERLQDELNERYCGGNVVVGQIHLPTLQFIVCNTGGIEVEDFGEKGFMVIDNGSRNLIVRDSDSIISKRIVKYEDQDQGSQFVTEIMRMINAMDIKTSDKIIKKLAKITSNSSRLTVKVWNHESDRITPDGWAAVDKFIGKKSKEGKIIITGGQYTNTYFKKVNPRCVANQGIDVSTQCGNYGFASAYDGNAGKSLGGHEYSYMIQEGAVLLLQDSVTWTANIFSDMVQMQIVSPHTGVVYAMQIKDLKSSLEIEMIGNAELIKTPTPDSDSERILHTIKATAI